jgi:hypothetical protein
MKTGDLAQSKLRQAEVRMIAQVVTLRRPLAKTTEKKPANGCTLLDSSRIDINFMRADRQEVELSIHIRSAETCLNKQFESQSLLIERIS